MRLTLFFLVTTNLIVPLGEGVEGPRFRCSVCDKRHDKSVVDVAFSPNGQVLAAVSTKDNGARAVTLWNVATGELRGSVAGLEGCDGLVFLPDGRTLAAMNYRELILCSTKTLRTRCVKALEGDYNTFAVSASGKTLAVGMDKTVHVLEVATGKEVGQCKGHTSAIASMMFSPDERTLATASLDSTAVLWDLTKFKEKHILQEHTGWVDCVAFAANGRMLATGSRDTSIKLWDVRTGRELSTMKGHKGGVRSLAFHPSGQVLASASYDGTVRIWDVATRKTVATLTRHAAAVNAVAFSPNGSILVTAGADGTAKLWDMPAMRP